ncbi:MAG TPA: hypothetical protein P5567_13620 [Kiritimatiellia bacterium]|nr:hypothetical protein [Kiritimatiellia bacterium]HRZ13482.1 hypothetical protein [Kiritimatiellia bacterium]HSA19640.1 hypothetical protein [Kiritimatiellia bacterium]
MKMALKLAACILLLAAGPVARAQVPARIHYQGRLLNGTNLFNGAVPIALQLYSNAAPSAGEAVLYAVTNPSVAVVDGLYALTLGTGTNSGNLPAALARPAVYLQVVVSNTVLLPRERLEAAPYAAALGSTTYIATAQAAVHLGTNGLFGQANAFTPDPFRQPGLFVECSISDDESSGMFLNGNTLVLWSPGDNNDLLRVYDEDDFAGGPRMKLDSDGNLYLTGSVIHTNYISGRTGSESDENADLRRRVAELEARVAELEQRLSDR